MSRCGRRGGVGDAGTGSMQILSITPLDKRRRRVLTDVGLAFALYQGEVKAYNLEEGGEVAEGTYREILEQVLFKRAKERALHLLQSRDRTELEIRKKLGDGHYPEEAIDYAVEFLKRYRFVDDENYGRNYIRAHGGKKSRRQLEFELRNKGLGVEVVGLLLEECQISEEEQIARFLAKKGYQKDASTPGERARLAMALARKGFSHDAVYSAVEGSRGGF